MTLVLLTDFGLVDLYKELPFWIQTMFFISFVWFWYWVTFRFVVIKGVAPE